jgi:hypothetical protein
MGRLPSALRLTVAALMLSPAVAGAQQPGTTTIYPDRDFRMQLYAQDLSVNAADKTATFTKVLIVKKNIRYLCSRVVFRYGVAAPVGQDINQSVACEW